MIRIFEALCVPFAAVVALAQTPAQVTPDGRALATGEFCYTISASKDGVTKPIGVTFQSVLREQFQGTNVLAVVVHQHLSSGKFDMRDSFLLRLDDLRPIRLDSERNGAPHAHLDYSDRRVTGWKMAGTTKQPIDLNLSGPVWDGNLWGETFAALPLEAGMTITLPIYQYDSGLGSFSIHVLAGEQEEAPIGKVQAWRIKAGLSPTEQVEYTVSTKPGLELSYSAGPSSQRLGGNCTGIE